MGALGTVRLSSRQSPRLAVIIRPGGHPPWKTCTDSKDCLEWQSLFTQQSTAPHKKAFSHHWGVQRSGGPEWVMRAEGLDNRCPSEVLLSWHMWNHYPNVGLRWQVGLSHTADQRHTHYGLPPADGETSLDVHVQKQRGTSKGNGSCALSLARLYGSVLTGPMALCGSWELSVSNQKIACFFFCPYCGEWHWFKFPNIMPTLYPGWKARGHGALSFMLSDFVH